jgi:preprotein translocase subunit SecD
MKFKLTWKIWLLIIILIWSLISIFGIPPKFLEHGILITSVEQNSTAFEQGLRQGQIITGIEGKTVNNVEDFSNIISEKFPSNDNIKLTVQTVDNEYILYSKEAPKITISDIPKTNLKTGLDISGGSRALVNAEGKKLNANEVNDLVAITKNRLNVYGLSDIKVVPVSDLSGDHYMLIEVAGATPKDLQELISKQGKFEAKIGNETVFVGGKDITSVCRNDATCAGIESCTQQPDGIYYCTFRFVVYLNEEAAKRHANITSQLGINSTTQGNYLSKPLNLYVDGNLVDSLLISEGLKGRITTQIQIEGSGKGAAREDAFKDATASMNNLQTILITGSLPYKLEIAKLDTVSPVLGKEFTRSILLAGIAALLAVVIIIFIRYRNFKSSMALLLTSSSEILIILGVASFINWNLDLPSIAGILATIGTGIDQQIIILDESRQSKFLSIKQRIKRAFTIIVGAYFTALVSLLPLIWAGAGLFKGFAITTLIGITIGILITRPAFSDIIKNFEE